MLYIYKIEYYRVVKNNDILKFAGKWMDLDMQIILKQKLLISCYFSKNKVHGHAIEKYAVIII